MVLRGYHHGTLAGKQWQPSDLAALGAKTGWEGIHLVEFVAVCLSESAGYDAAHCNNYADAAMTKLLSEDIGLMQINIAADQLNTPETKKLWVPADNVARAYEMWKTRGWQPWHGFTDNIALNPDMKGKYVQRACWGVMNYYRRQYGMKPLRWSAVRRHPPKLPND